MSVFNFLQRNEWVLSIFSIYWVFSLSLIYWMSVFLLYQSIECFLPFCFETIKWVFFYFFFNQLNECFHIYQSLNGCSLSFFNVMDECFLFFQSFECFSFSLSNWMSAFYFSIYWMSVFHFFHAIQWVLSIFSIHCFLSYLFAIRSLIIFTMDKYTNDWQVSAIINIILI